jgi:hypothetical protein
LTALLRAGLFARSNDSKNFGAEEERDGNHDGPQDGFELHYLSGTSDTCTVAVGACTSARFFTAASSNTPTTSALDRDTDDHGTPDNVKEAGIWCYVGETSGRGPLSLSVPRAEPL